MTVRLALVTGLAMLPQKLITGLAPRSDSGCCGW